jgi:hypothetical protein
MLWVDAEVFCDFSGLQKCDGNQSAGITIVEMLRLKVFATRAFGVSLGRPLPYSQCPVGTGLSDFCFRATHGTH